MSEFETRTFGDVVCFLGDCLSADAFIRSASIDMVFADLPYGVHKKMAWDKGISFPAFWAVMAKISKEAAAVILTANFRFAIMAAMSNLKEFRYDLIWDKRYASNFLMAKKRPLCYHELVLIFAKKQTTYHPQMLQKSKTSHSRGTKWNGRAINNDHFQSTIFRNDMPSNVIYPRSVLTGLNTSNKHAEMGLHPTQKPVALLEWLIRTYTNPGDLILDPTAGSGTTGIAALNLGRRAILIEKDPTYFEVMCKRIAEHQAKLAANA